MISKTSLKIAFIKFIAQKKFLKKNKENFKKNLSRKIKK